jgi:hypothetical protein
LELPVIALGIIGVSAMNDLSYCRQARKEQAHHHQQKT